MGDILFAQKIEHLPGISRTLQHPGAVTKQGIFSASF
jgi:hypothetical protein